MAKMMKNKYVMYLLVLFTFIGGLVHLLAPAYNLLELFGGAAIYVQFIAGLLTLIYVWMNWK